MLMEETCAKLNTMKLYGMLGSVRQRLDDPVHRDLSTTELEVVRRILRYAVTRATSRDLD